jgi:tryptophan synthase alpha chain
MFGKRKLDTDSPRAGGAIGEVFARCRAEKRAAFIPFIFAGDPSLEATEELLDALVAGGADIIELGVPFSDPMADGPVNQRAAYRAIEAGTTLAGILELVARKRAQLAVPIVLFTYYNPIFVYGLKRFAEHAAASGVDGVLCVDLPPEEGASEVAPVLLEAGISTIFLLAPTSTRERRRKVSEASSGFVYYVSRAGVTGERSDLRSQLGKEVKAVARDVRLPVAVGFGISTPEQVREVAGVADGVVVGSALVRVIEENLTSPDLAAKLQARVQELVSGLTRS